MAGDSLSAKEAALIAQAREAPEEVGATRPQAAERAAALLAAARAEQALLRRRQRRLYLWAPVMLLSGLAVWSLLWMWQKL